MSASFLDKLSSTASTALALRRYLRKTLPSTDPATEIQRRLRDREARFLWMIERAVFDNPQSPYLALLRHVGCELEDIRHLVFERGLESTLDKLSQEGVYIAHDEMKGRQPARRGSAVFHFRPEDFDNPLLRTHFRGTTSGTTGRPTKVRINFDHLEERLPQTLASLRINGMQGAAHALWYPPMFAAMYHNLRLSRVGHSPQRWFSQVAVNPFRPPLGPRIEPLGLVALCNLFGARIPPPRHVPPSSPQPIVNWMASVLRRGVRVLVMTYVSSAVRACQWAKECKISLNNGAFMVAGEPVTAASRRAIEESGASCLPYFAAVELGKATEACLMPSSADDTHLCSDLFALRQRSTVTTGGDEVKALLFTSMSPTAQKILLNAETGDSATVDESPCDCPWYELGFKVRLRDIWSFAKMTAEGLTFTREGVTRILEEDLPQHLGGRQGDYQLRIEPDETGATHYLLYVNPDLAGLDDDHIRQVFLENIGRREKHGRLVAEFLREAGKFKVVRRPPSPTAGAKFLSIVNVQGSSGEH